MLAVRHTHPVADCCLGIASWRMLHAEGWHALRGGKWSWRRGSATRSPRWSSCAGRLPRPALSRRRFPFTLMG